MSSSRSGNSSSSHQHHHEEEESSLSSLSAGLSAYNAAEPKPVSSANNSIANRSRQSSMSSSSRQQHPPPPTTNRSSSSQGGGGGSVASGLTGRSSRGGGSRSNNKTYIPEDERSSATERLVGLVNELTHNNNQNQPSYEDQWAMEEERRRLRETIRGELDHEGDDYEDAIMEGGGGGVYGEEDHHSRSRSGGGSSRRSVDPNVMSPNGGGGGGSKTDVPPSNRSVTSRNSRRSGGGGGRQYDPGEFGADDPDGRHYAPTTTTSSNMPSRPPPPMESAYPYGRRNSRQESTASSSRGGGGGRGGGQENDQGDETYYSGTSRSKQSRMSRSHYDDDEDEDESTARGSQYSSGNSTKQSNANNSKGGGIATTDLTRYSKSDESASSATARSSKKIQRGQVKEAGKNKRAMWWYNFSKCVTCPFPDSCIRKEDAEAKQAWREKVAICFCVLLTSSFFVGMFGFVPILLCRERTVYTLPDVQERTNENWIVVNGYVYDVNGLFERHPGGPGGVEAFLHEDASRMFPRTPPALLPPMCVNAAKMESNEDLQSKKPVCSDFNFEDVKNGLPCHDFVTGVNATAKFLGEFEKGVLAHDGAALIASPFTFWVSIHDRVYNVTEYVNNIRNEQTKQIEKDHPMAYLEPTLNNLVINKLNEDATELFLSVYPDDRILGCMDELFYVGIIDTRFDVVCFVLNVIMYFLLCFVASIMIAQMFCSLMYIAKGTRTYSVEDTQDQVIVMVPCYNEGGIELIKTLDSVLATTYPEENKVVFIIADGVVTGAGQDLSTPEHLAEILGFEMDPENDELYSYGSIGLLTSNRARVYHGYYELEDKSLKYLVVVKHGLPMEQTGSAKPGNRGKRDSQLIIMGYFNRVYHGRELTELDAAIEDALIDLNMQSDDMRLLMTIDADTRVDELSITHMTYTMNQNERILAVCGETKVDNKWQSWVTMMQVFEYYNNHHMKKAFESAFGCVTCLPGCFTMYRILNDDGKPLLADDHVYAEYLRNDIDSLHEQNLFHLGEDRMLTTLLLHFFPGNFLSYVPEAQCFTIVPHTMKILLSQRRRWINSTYHNLLELTKVKTMCGVCCCSMKTVVYLDLIACMILPASTVYAGYLIFLVAAGKTQFSLLLLVLYGLIFGVQIVVFIVRSRYDFLFWFIYFTLVGVPVFYFILPLYAFWHMDDFSWGETRKVAAMKQSYAKPKSMEEEEDKDEDDYDSTEEDEEEDDESEMDSRRRGRRNID